MDDVSREKAFSWSEYLGPRLGMFCRRLWAGVLILDQVAWFVFRKISRFLLRVAGECVYRPVWTLFRIGIVLAVVAHFCPSVNVYGRRAVPHRAVKHTRKSGDQLLTSVPPANES